MNEMTLFDLDLVLQQRAEAIEAAGPAFVGFAPADLGDAPTEVLRSLCHRLVRLDGAARFALGDAAGEWVLRDGPSAVSALAGYDVHHATFANAMAISAKVPFSVRRPALSWTHHCHVAHLDVPGQALWLDRAERGDGVRRWTAEELRQALKGAIEADQPALDGLGRLPRPPETSLRAALDGGARWVLWGPGDGNLAGARVRHVEARGTTAMVLVEVPASMAAVLDDGGEAA